MAGERRSKSETVTKTQDSDPQAVEASTRALLRWGVQHSPMPLALVGPPRQGKTTLSRTVAEELGWGYRVSNVQYLNPEELGGIPLLPKDGKGGQEVRWTLPSLITDDMLSGKPYLWVLDEIDKAHEDTMGCLLSLFDFQRRIHTTVLPSSVRLMAILNDPDALIEPLAGRFAYLAYPAPGDLAGRLNGELAGLESLAQMLYSTAPEVKFPSRPSSPESMYALAAWLKTPGFWVNEAVRSRIVRGLFPLQVVPEVLGYLQSLGEQAPPLSPAELVEWVKAAPISTAARLLIGSVEAIYVGGKAEEVNATVAELEKLQEAPDTPDELKKLLKRWSEDGIPRVNTTATDKETVLLKGE